MNHSIPVILVIAAALALILDVAVIYYRHRKTMASRLKSGLGRLVSGRFAIMLGLICLAYLMVFAVLERSERERTIEFFQKLELNNATQIAQNLERQIQIIQAQLRLIGRVPGIVRNDKEGSDLLQKSFIFMVVTNRLFRGGIRVSTDGRTLLKVPAKMPFEKVIINQAKTLQGSQSLVSAPFQSGHGFKAITLIEPVYEGKALAGWIGVLLDFDSLMACCAEPKTTGGIAKVGLVDRNGKILVDVIHVLPSRTIFEVTSNEPGINDVTRRLLNEESGTFRYASSHGANGKLGKKNPRAGAFARVHLGNGDFWVAGVTAEESAILAQFPSVHWPEVVICLLFFAMIVLATADRLRDEQRYAETLEHKIDIQVDDLRRSEGRFTTVVEQSTEAIFLTDINGIVQYANPACCSLTGLRCEDVVGRHVRRMLGRPARKEFCRQALTALKAGATWQGHLTNKRRDGSAYEVEAVISPIRDAWGAVTQFVSVSRDVTQELALEAQLRQAQKMDAVGKLAGGVAHDFNNVLTAIVGNLQLAQRLADQRVARFLKDALTASGRATEMVRQLLTFSRKSSGVREPVAVNALVSETVRLFEKSIDRRIRVISVLAKDLPQVTADPNQIHQVIMNLCVNSRDAINERIKAREGTDAGNGHTGMEYRITIQTRTETVTEEYCRMHSFAHVGNFVVVTVGDEGAGMDRETLARIFEPFFTTKGAEQGTGLGLSTVYGIVKSHNGWVHVASEPGVGSVFKVYFPVAAAEQSRPVEKAYANAAQ